MSKRHSILGLQDQDVLAMYETMLLARRIDERMWLLNRAGKIPFVIPSQGQEAAQVGAAFALDREKDYVLPYYRDLAVVLAFGMSAKDILLSGFAKAEDPSSGGRQMPGHFGSKKHRIVTGSSPVTTQVPHAVGIALAAKMKQEDFVSLVTFGEGSSNQGDFHEGINFAAVHKLPVIFMCENNKYAISVPLAKQVACEKISDRAVGYGIPGYTIDGTDALEVYKVVREAAERARKGEGPALVEVVTERLADHTSDDDHRTYRSQEEIASLKNHDPLMIFQTYLYEANVLTVALEETMNDRVMAMVDEATEYAEHAPYAKPEETLSYVYEE